MSRETQDAQVALQARMQIEYNMEKEMARGRPKAKNEDASKLLAALNFIGIAGTKTVDHCMLVDGMALMTDGQLFAGHPIEANLDCCPHLERLKSALDKCGKTLDINLLDSGRLSIKGEKLNALVPCLEFEVMADVEPDTNIAPIDDRLKEAFKCCIGLADENADNVLEASLLLEANTCTSTDRHVIMQYWHGINLPPLMVIPKLFAKAVAKVEAKLIGFGWSEGHSITFWFDDGSWIRTLLYADKWPDIAPVLNRTAVPGEIPEGLFEAVAAIEKFSDDGTCFFEDGQVQSHQSDKVGAQYSVPNLVGGKQFNIDQLLEIAPFAKSIDYCSYPNHLAFFSDTCRGQVATLIKEG